MTRRARPPSLALCAAGLAASLAGACRGERSASQAPAPASEAPAPDRLGPDEQLPEAETAFGLPLPRELRLVRHFDDAAYFAGRLDVAAVLEHVQRHVTVGTVQMKGRGAVFPRTTIAGDDTGRLVRIEVSETARGSQLHIEDITPPPPAIPTDLPQAEIWRRAGRNPDGTLIDPNSVF